MTMGHNGIADRLYETIQGDLQWQIEKLAESCSNTCESLIEAAFLAALLIKFQFMFWRVDRDSNNVRLAVCPPSLAEKPSNGSVFWMVPQFKWDRYRIDFAIFCKNFEEPRVFIECDGHEFHERTAAQAEHDRSRDRACQIAGIPVLRFTGREIWRDPFKCADQACGMLARRIE